MSNSPFTSATFGRPTPSQLATWKERLPQASGFAFLYCEELAANAVKGAKGARPDQTTFLIVDGKAIYASSMNAALPDSLAKHGNGVSAICLPSQQPFDIEAIVDTAIARAGKIYEVRSATYEGFLAGCDKIDAQKKNPRGTIRRLFEKYRAVLDRAGQ